MRKRIYISADYDEVNGDRDVVDILVGWGNDNKHKVDFVDMAAVTSGTVANEADCRICDLKKEFNKQINASSTVVFVVGNKTASRVAGSACCRNSKNQDEWYCTPYKGNAHGRKPCKVGSTRETLPSEDVGTINSYSYIKHEYLQAVRSNKEIIILYNSTRHEQAWLPAYMDAEKLVALPFWTTNNAGNSVENYEQIKYALGF